MLEALHMGSKGVEGNVIFSPHFWVWQVDCVQQRRDSLGLVAYPGPHPTPCPFRELL